MLNICAILVIIILFSIWYRSTLKESFMVGHNSESSNGHNSESSNWPNSETSNGPNSETSNGHKSESSNGYKSVSSNGHKKDKHKKHKNNDTIYNSTALYPFDTSYDKLLNIFTSKNNSHYFNDCKRKEDILGRKYAPWIKELNMTLKLVACYECVFNREDLPVTREFHKRDNGTVLPVAQSVVDVFNEKSNKTSILTELSDIEILTTEDQKQYTMYIYLNYPVMQKNNTPGFENIKLRVVLVRRRILQDDIFAPFKYDTSKYIITNMKLIDNEEVNNVPIVEDYDDHYSFKKLMTEATEITSDKYTDNMMIRTRKMHDDEMDFRNITIEDDYYLNDYMYPEKDCRKHD